MNIKVSINKIRKHKYENWNHYKFEDYNRCPFCDGSIRMWGQVNEHQVYECHSCGKKFTLNAITEEIELEPKVHSTNERYFRIRFEVDNGEDYVEDVAIVKATSSELARLNLKHYISRLPSDILISRIIFVEELTQTIITNKFGSKE